MADILDIAARAFTLPVCVGIFANGLDDLFIDVNYFLRGLFLDRSQRMRVEDLRAAAPKRIAIMVPAWQEEGVIREMLQSNLRTIDYPADRYDIFVGTYKNDEATQRRVDEVARRAPNVHKVVTPHDGPTCKADCLNWIYQGIQVLEERRGARFDILLMHDAEDIIHPLSLRLYSYLIPEHEFVQTPVFPLETPWHKLVAGTYKDEFTEHHLKDMLVRERLGGLVPSAGVGSAFARDVFEDIALAHQQEAFNVGSLTEDYEIGLKFRLAGKRTYFARRAVQRYVTVERGWFRKRPVEMVEDEYIATREYFPDSFRFAVRQRSRWVLGITLQGWEQVGWSGPLPVLYCLWRDRKALFTHVFTIAAYLVALYCLGRMGLGALIGRPWSIENVFPPGSVLWWLVMANTVILAWRFAMKMIAVHRVYGWLHSILSVPRLFLANIINFVATAKAFRQYVVHRWTGEPLRWLKTEHVFPSTEALAPFHRRLGDLLREREGLSVEDLDVALGLQARTRLPLGEVIDLSGMLPAPAVAASIAAQLELRVCQPQPYAIPLDLLGRLPEREAVRLGVLPLGPGTGGRTVVAVASTPDGDLASVLEAQLGGPVDLAFCPRAALDTARTRAYRRLSIEPQDRPVLAPLGERLVGAGLISAYDLERALSEQAATGEFLGELLVRRGLLRSEDLGPQLDAPADCPFEALDPDQVSAAALRRLGFGFCALHRAAPLRTEKGGVVLAVAQRLGGVALRHAARLLDREPAVQLSPATDVALALAIGARRAWPDGLGGGIPGLDGAELRALDVAAGAGPDPRALWDAARLAGKGPLAHALDEGLLSAAEVLALRARVLGIAAASPVRGATPLDLPAGSAVEAAGLTALLADGELLLAAPDPRPWMTVEATRLFPRWPLAWRVAPAGATLIPGA